MNYINNIFVRRCRNVSQLEAASEAEARCQVRKGAVRSDKYIAFSRMIQS